MAESRLFSDQEQGKDGPAQSLHTDFAAIRYVHLLVCVMCSFEFVSCAVFSLRYVQSLACVMCRFSVCCVQFAVTMLVALL